MSRLNDVLPDRPATAGAATRAPATAAATGSRRRFISLLTFRLPGRASSEPDEATAGPSAAGRARPDGVRADPVARHGTHRERSAGGDGRGEPVLDEVRVVGDPDVPALPGPVGVDLELDGDPSVVVLGLQLPDAAAARAAGAHPGSAAGLGRADGEHGRRAEHCGETRGGSGCSDV